MATRSSNPVSPAVEFKGRMATLTMVRVNEGEPSKILDAVDRHLGQAPGFFNGLPMVLEGEALGGFDGEALRGLRDALTERGLSIMGVAGDIPGDDVLSAAGMARLRVGGGAAPEAETKADGEQRKPASGGQRATPEPSEEPPPRRSKLVTQPVRSGQQIYARDGDLVLLASVSRGAEVLADGHIHVYASLSGRALAGVRGDQSARIFCRRFDPELVAIAGHYQVSEQIADSDRGREIQIALEHEALTIAPLPPSG